MKLLLALALLISTAPLGRPASTEPLKIEHGLIQGFTQEGLGVYLGIPFAAPPVGDLRWRGPQPAADWEGVKQTTKFSPDPIQGAGTGPGVSEDCLYLNVWTPAKSSAERVPVLVWIYGGGFSFGSASAPVHNGAHLAKKGVVLVSLNYRVGPLGFLAHPELSAESPMKVSGNYGLQDMIAGLKWIRKNIDKFGGDPNQVTIFGESAGGIAVSMLCASPEAKGLFHGAISQSGGSFGPTRTTTYPGENMKTLQQAEQAGVVYAGRAGVSSLAALRNVAPDKLPGGWDSGAAWPIVDGWIIPDDQYKLYLAGKFNDTPILVGYNSDEGASFSYAKTPAEHTSSAQLRYGPFAEPLLKAYPLGTDKITKTARDLMRDAAFGWQTWSWARLQSRTGKSKVFYYYFDQHPDHADGSDGGTPHGVDVPYVFQTLDTTRPEAIPSDAIISEALATYWTNFAKRGNPNGEGQPEWPEFTEANRQVMHFHHKPFVGSVPSPEALEVLDRYFAWRRTPEGAAASK